MANYTILLIDYEPRSIERFRQPLTDAGYNVEIATDGLAGIEAFHRLNPDMVLVEAMIPKKHGFEVCQELKRSPHGRRTPVLITTGVYKGRKYRTQALHIYGCDEYIEKPIAPEQLLAVVGKFFSGKPAATTSAAPAEAAVRPAPAPRDAAPARPPQGKPSSSRGTVTDLTEDEIMARLDAILPGADAFGESPGSAEAPSTVVAIDADAETSIDLEPLDPPAEVDPFLQMQAELNAELGSLATALALEPAPVLDSPEVPSIPSDQVPSPSVLETLSAPETIATVPLAEPNRLPSPAPAEEVPGQVVSFDAKRSRKSKKHGKKTPDRPTIAVARTPEAPKPRPRERTEPVPRMTMPSGTLVESELRSPEVKRSGSLWIWAVLALIAIGAVYFVFFRTPSTESTESPPSIERPAPPTETPVETAATPEPPAADEPAGRDLVLNSVEPLPTGASPERVAAPVTPPVNAPTAGAKPVIKPRAEEPAAAVSAAAKTAAKTPAAGSSAPATRLSEWHAPAPPSDPETPSGLDEQAAAGVETIAEAPVPLEPVAALAPGTLVAEPDTPPMSLSRKLPVYSFQARELKLSGTVVMDVLVNESGTVDEVVLISGVKGADLNDSALKAARSWTYRPATKSGVPVKVWKREQVVFKR